MPIAKNMPNKSLESFTTLIPLIKIIKKQIVTIKSPNNGRGLMNYGLTFMRKGEYVKALDLFKKAKLKFKCALAKSAFMEMAFL